MKKYKALFASWLMIAALIAPFRVNAQTLPSLTIQSAFSQVCHEHPTQCPGSFRVVGNNTLNTMYPLGGVPFPATASGSCGSGGSYPFFCNGVYVKIGPYNEYSQLLYVSPTQINFVADYSPRLTSPTERTVEVIRDSDDVVTHRQNFVFDSFLAMPHSDYRPSDGQKCQRGDAYNTATGAYLGYVGNCAPFPGTAGGQPTTIQLYFSGKSCGFCQDGQVFDVYVNGDKIINDGQAYMTGFLGWAVINVTPPSWLVGENTIQIFSNGSIDLGGGTIIPAFQGPYLETTIVVAQ